ncbi:CatA-like O-acetyltransferase [Flavobacteriaceae bacterium M23B6Z8]
MSQLFDIESWKRKEHFHFFKDFEEPFFGITFDADVTYLYEHCKKEKISIYAGYLYAILKAVNHIKEFRLRIKEDNTVILYDRIGVSATVNRENNTFGFSHVEYDEDFNEFLISLKVETERVELSNALFPDKKNDDVIYFSALPWVKFTGLSHARSYRIRESVPRISTGKIYTSGQRRLMPVSVHVHHAMMDGYHVGLFVEKLQQILNEELIKSRTV